MFSGQVLIGNQQRELANKALQQTSLSVALYS
jgi:hypothetical protein